MGLGKGLGHQRNADDYFRSSADPGKEAVNAEVERRLCQSLQSGEDAVDQDAERECANPADIVCNDSEREAADRPAEQPDGAENAADPPDIGNAGIPAQ